MTPMTRIKMSESQIKLITLMTRIKLSESWIKGMTPMTQIIYIFPQICVIMKSVTIRDSDKIHGIKKGNCFFLSVKSCNQ